MSYQGYFNESMRKTGDIDKVRDFVCCMVRVNTDECLDYLVGARLVMHWALGIGGARLLLRSVCADCRFASGWRLI